jgi:iron complex transport system substrate-binding protein
MEDQMVRIFSEVLGKDLAIPDVPMRIVSLSPAITETLFLLGLEDRVVGVSNYCLRPSDVTTKRKVGSYSVADLATLAELKPDLILTTTGYQRSLSLSLSKDFTVYPLELPVSVAGIVDMVVKIGLVSGARSQARRLAKDLWSFISGLLELPSNLKVYIEDDLGGPVTFGAYSYVNDALSLMGASNIFGEEASVWLCPDFTEVMKRDPSTF